MFNLDNWKQPIYKNDVIGVIVNGLLSAFLVGTLAGALDYLFWLIRIPISIGLIICTLAVGSRVKRGYYNYHVLYPILALFFLLLGLFISEIIELLLLYRDFGLVGKLLITPDFYLDFILSPIYYIRTSFKTGNVLQLILGIVNTGIYVWSFYYCYKLAKGSR